MSNSRFVIRLASAPGILLLLTVGCASSWVKKPDILSVKKLGIVSIYGNTALLRINANDVSQRWDEQVKTDVAQNMEKEFAKHFTMIGWKVTPSALLTATPNYVSYFRPPDAGKALGLGSDSLAGRTVSFLQKKKEESHLNNFFTPKGIWPIGGLAKEAAVPTINLFGGEKTLTIKEKLVKFAQASALDALALVQVRYCYKAGTFSAIGGLGAAYLHVDSTVQVIDKRGEIVVNMPEIEGRCGKNPIEIDQKLTMVGGELFIGVNIAGFNIPSESATETVKDAFFAANKATALKTVNLIRAEMAK